MASGQQRIERKLAAIFAADVAGYSRLMGQDEVGTLRALTDCREIMDGLIREHGGRIANTAGDSVLAEFPSAVDAVQCAVVVQEAITTTSEQVEEQQRARFRIGIHVGDVMVREGDLFGDAVNIAARLQALAEPSSICLSGAAHEFVRKILPLSFDDLGQHTVKNVAEPVQAFGIREPNRQQIAQSRPLPLPEKPSIAILPFVTASPDDEYLADGVADEVITALSRVRWLFVIARNSSFAYKGRAVQVGEIARELGVAYILTGSMRRSASRIRISTQLVEGETGVALWADRYDRELSDIFALQEEIADQITGAIEPELLKKEGQRAGERPVQSPTAWNMVRRGVWEFHKFTPASLLSARDLFRKAIEAAPNEAEAYLWLGRANAGLVAYDWSDDPDKDLKEGVAASQRAVQLDDRNPYSHYSVAVTHVFSGVLDVGARAAERAISLSPSFALGHLILGAARLFAGQPKEASEALERGLRLSPSDPNNLNWFLFAGLAYYFSGQPEKGLAAARRSLELRPRWGSALKLVVLCSCALGDDRQARSARAEFKSSGDMASDLTRFIATFQPAWGVHIHEVMEKSQ